MYYRPMASIKNIIYILHLLLFLRSFGGVYAKEKCGVSYKFNERIVGGNNTVPGEYPWLLSLQLKIAGGFKHVCGATILNENWAISAGHCAYQLETQELFLVTGDYNLFIIEGTEKRHAIEKIITNHFDMATFDRDVSLMKVRQSFQFNFRVSPICLPNSDDLFYGYGTVAGWGRTEENKPPSDTIQQVTVPLIRKTLCEYNYKRIGFSRYLHPCQLCAGLERGGKDACQGDSGGPLMCKKEDGLYYLCGIVSWGLGCGKPGFLGIYVKVSCFVDWINTVI